MSLTQLLGGPQFDVSSNEYALYADFHYFFNSGSVIRTNPWNSPSTPVAKVLNVTNVTENDVALNYVNTSGSIVATTMTSGSTTQIISQTLPLGLDNNNWLSASFVSNHLGSVVARTTGSRFFEMAAIRTISQATDIYTIADGATTITKASLSFPVSGSSLRYVCSRTIPYLNQPFWLIRDLVPCPGGTTTTTTTAAPTTTTTTLTPGCFIYNVVNNGVGTGFVNYVACGSGSTYRQFSLPGGASGSICVDNYQINTDNFNMNFTLTGTSCTSGSTTTTTLAPTTTTTTAGTTTTTTAVPTTTTTAAPTTTTTTTLASQKYLLTSCEGPGDIIGVFTILNAPLLAPGDGIRIGGTGIAGLYCFTVNNTSTGTSINSYSITNIYRGVPCDDCTE